MTGERLGTNPFSADGRSVHSDVGYSNITVIVRVEHDGKVAYGFLEAADFNYAYWKGHTDRGRYELRVPLIGSRRSEASMIANLRRAAVLVAALLAAGGPAAQSLDSEEARTAEALGLRPGLSVADVGTGNGEWAERIGREVGESGHVYATEVDRDKLREAETRLKDAGLKNVTTILGTQEDTGLPAGCCDAILLRMVYHHFVDPARMRASLRSALRRGAPLVVIDTEPQKGWRQLEQGVPDRGGHGIKEEDLLREMTADGFQVVARHDDWPGDGKRYCVVFRSAEGS